MKEDIFTIRGARLISRKQRRGSPERANILHKANVPTVHPTTSRRRTVARVVLVFLVSYGAVLLWLSAPGKIFEKKDKNTLLSLTCSAAGRVESINCPAAQKERFWHDCDWGLVEKYRSQLVERFQSSESAPSLRCLPNDKYCESKRVLLDTTVDNVFNTDGLWTTTLLAVRPWDGNKTHCNEHFDGPSIILKPDSHANFYHALCDFINIFASMHIPQDWYSVPYSNSSRSSDSGRQVSQSQPESLKILMAPSQKNSIDTFSSPFLSLYEAYTDKPVRTLNRHWQKGSTLCFDDLVFSLNPRGGQPSLFYNMIVPGDCFQSRLFRDWIDFATARKPFLDSLSRKENAPGSRLGQPIRFALLTRNSGQGSTSGTRHLMNQDDLLQALEQSGRNLQVTLLDFDWTRRVALDEQLSAILNTDILASMHGAGLAHLSFLPPWGVAYEIYDCGDRKCYSDLSRLAGIKYLSGRPEDATKVKPLVPVMESQLGNPKFWNYVVDKDKFVGKVREAVDYITSNPNSPYYDGCSDQNSSGSS